MLYLLITICCLDADPFPRWIRDLHIKPKEWGGSSSEINAEDQAKQEAVVAECNVETVNKNPCQRSVAASKLQIYVHNGGHSLHQSNDWTSSLLFFLSALLLTMFIALGVPHYIMSSFFSPFLFCMRTFVTSYVLTTCTLRGFFDFLLPTCPASTRTFPCQSFSCSYV